jgi:aromatic-L-amino-acid/L-tryptophan decarboxylase
VSALEPDRAELQRWLDVVAKLGFDAIDALPGMPAVGPLGAAGMAIAEAVSLPIPEAPHPGGIDELATLIGRAAAASLGTIGPGYLAYVPGGGLPSAAIADFAACLLNRFTGLTAAAPALCRLEADVLAWLAQQFDLPASTRGLLTSGGSLANLAAIVTARHARFGDTGELADAIVYVSAQAHVSVAKAVRIAGIPHRNVRSIATDARLRLDIDALAAAIAEDRLASRIPLMVVSAAGTTNTGAVDPLGAIAELCARERLWHHVDAAYGGAFVLCDEGKRRLAGIERADSVTFDPHKGMFLPYGTGCVLVRDGERLRDAHHLPAPYLQDFDALDRTGEPPSPTEYGPELSRDYRGLRLWLPLQLHGAGAFRRALGEKLALAERFHAMLSAAAGAGRGIEIIDAPQLSIVAWRLAREPGEPLTAWNARNQGWLRRINARARVHLSSTVLPVTDGAAFTLRACVLSFRTHQPHVDACFDDVLAAL